MKTKTLYRPNVGIMLINDHNQVFMAKRSDIKHDSWQMPQGGIDEDEDIINAAKRELYEETAIHENDIKFLDITENWHHYDYPESAFQNNEHIKNGPYKGQAQKWVLFEFIGDSNNIDLNNAEHNEFIAHQWVDLNKITDLTVEFRKDTYTKIIKEFTLRCFL